MSATDQFFPVDPTDSTRFAFPQSQLYNRMEARNHFEREARGEPEESVAVSVYKPQPLFPPSAHHLVVWGLDGVLVNISASIEKAYKERTIDALQKLLPGTDIDKAKVHALVHQGYAETGQPCKYVAFEYGVNEAELQIDMLSRVAYEDIALRPNGYGMGDQGLLNYFQASRSKGVKHAVVTSATGYFAETCLNFSVLRQYVDAVIGSERRRNNSDGILPKHINAGEFFDMMFPAGEFGDRYPSMIVVDHNLEFLAAAKARGMTTVLTDPDGRHAVKPPEADYKVCAPHKVFEQVLGIRDPGSRRDSHVYSLSASPK